MTRRPKYALPLPNVKARLTPALNLRGGTASTNVRRPGSQFLGGPPLRAA